MKARLLLALAFALSQALILSGPATAHAGPAFAPPPPQGPAGEMPVRQQPSAGPADYPAAPSTVALGQPGQSYSYVQTFGTTDTAYPGDSAHLNHPYGLAAAGSNIWVAESLGLRALKYTSNGVFLSKIGQAGFRRGASDQIDLSFITAVKADGSGNVWIADADVRQVFKFNSAGSLLKQLGQAWQAGTDSSHFNTPMGLAVDSAGNLFVSDGSLWYTEAGNHRIQVFNSSGTFLTTIGTTGIAGPANSQFHGLRHIAIAGNTLYVADSGNQRIQILNITSPISPTYVATLGVTGVSGHDNTHLYLPSGVAVDASHIYVADTGNNRVQVYNKATLAYMATIGAGQGAANNQFWAPTDVAVDTAGNLYVADYENNRVQQFNSSWAYVRTYGTTGVPYLTDGNHFNQAAGVAVAPDGSLYVTEYRGARLLKLSSTGAFQWSVGQPGTQSPQDNVHFSAPHDIGVDSAGHVYVADAGLSRVQIYNPDGSYFATLGTGYGIGQYQFSGAYGLAVDSADNIYVVDENNQRVQIYDHNRAYVATLGVTGVAGTDNAHFKNPFGVAVDSSGNIYVVENGNHRVQVFDKNRVYRRTIGVTGVPGYDFGHLSNPTAVAVDSAGRTYVADGWGQRVQVFDAAGAYLTTIGSNWGSSPGQLRQAVAMKLDRSGNLYVADLLAHRVEKYSPGVAGWVQTNINGFGAQPNQITSLAGYSGQLYAGTYSLNGGSAQLWRATDGRSWTPVMTNGFGTANNVGIYGLMAFDGQLYAATASQHGAGAELWRSPDGSGWGRVVSQGFGDPTNGAILPLAVYNGALYAATSSYTATHGAEIWRSTTGNSGDWARVVANGFGAAANQSVVASALFNNDLYVGTYNWDTSSNASTGGQVWRTDGTNWTQVSAAGFGAPANFAVQSLAVFDGYLYAGTAAGTPSAGAPAQLWRCSASSGCASPGDWSQVMVNGFGHPHNVRIVSLISNSNMLYAVTANTWSGAEVWRTPDGTTWQQVAGGGFGNSNNANSPLPGSAAIFADNLYLGTVNPGNGGQIWEPLNRILYLPLVQR